MKKSALAICLIASPTFACNPDDLAGRWNMLFADMSCEFTVQANGRVSRGNCLQLAEDPADSGVRNPVRGKLSVQSSCRVTGTLNTENRESKDIKLKIGQSRLGQGLEYWHGLVWVGVRAAQGIDGFGSGPEFIGDYARFSSVYMGAD